MSAHHQSPCVQRAELLLKRARLRAEAAKLLEEGTVGHPLTVASSPRLTRADRSAVCVTTCQYPFARMFAYVAY